MNTFSKICNAASAAVLYTFAGAIMVGTYRQLRDDWKHRAKVRRETESKATGSPKTDAADAS